MRCRVKPHPLVPVHLHAINCTYMRARWPECLVNFVRMFRCAYTCTHTCRHVHTHAQKCARTHACAQARAHTHATCAVPFAAMHTSTMFLIDSRTRPPAVPKAVQMLGLTADRFHTAVITGGNSERLYRQILAKWTPVLHGGYIR